MNHPLFRKLFMASALCASISVRAVAYSVTATYYESVNTTIHVSGSLYECADGTVLDMTNRDPSNPSSYTDRHESMPTEKILHTQTVEIAGDLAITSQLALAAIAATIDMHYRSTHEAGTNRDEYGRVSNGIISGGISVVNGNRTETLSRGALGLNSPLAGDPVRVTTGQFVLAETDARAEFGAVSFEVTRRYDGGTGASHSFGAGWWSSLDTCVVRGMKPDAKEELDRMTAMRDEIAGVLASLRDDKEEIEAGYAEYTEKYRVIDRLLHDQLGTLRQWNDPESSDVCNNRIATENAIATGDSDFFRFRRSYPSMVSECASTIASYERLLAEVEVLVVRETNEYTHYLHNASLNSALAGRTGFLDGAYCGNDRLILRDENGSIHVYRAIDPPDYSSIGNAYPGGTATVNETRGDSSELLVLPDERLRWKREDGSVWQYDARGLIESIENRFGSTLAFAYSGNELVSITRDGKALIGLSRSPVGEITELIDAAGRTASYTYTAGFLSRIADFDGDAVSYEYCEGLLTAIRKADKVRPDDSSVNIEYGFDGPAGAMVSATVNEEGGVERFEYDLAGRVTRHASQNGELTVTRYDAEFRPILETYPDGTVKEYSYYADTGLLREVAVTDTEGSSRSTVAYSYDGAGNTTGADYSDGTSESWQWNEYRQMTMFRDRDGYCQWNEYSPDGASLNVFVGLDRARAVLSQRVEYDSWGRVVREITGTGAERSYAYDSVTGCLAAKTVHAVGGDLTETWTHDAAGRMLSYADAGGRLTTYAYPARARGESRKVIESLPSGLTKMYEYDARKDLVRLTERDVDGTTRVTTAEYDRRHLPVRVIDGSGSTVEYAYREDGKPLSETRGAWVTAYEYERATGRLSSIVTSRMKEDGTVASRGITAYEYARNGRGLASSVIDGDARNEYQYDAWGRVVGVTNALGESSFRELSGAGRALREQTASGGVIEYGYDDAFGSVSAAGKEGRASARVVYNDDGTIRSRTDRTGTVTRYEYDGRGLVVAESTDAGVKRWAYDSSGRVVREDAYTIACGERPASSSFTEWSYSEDDRAITVSRGGLYATDYALNGWGEIVSMTDGEGNTRRNRYDGSGRIAATVDGYGRETRYAWNDIGKISSIAYPDGTVETREYDHDGNATRIADACGTKWLASYDSSGRLIHEIGRPGIDLEYRYDALGRIVETESGGETVESFSYGERGTDVTIRDGRGAVYAYRNDGFGATVSEKNRLGASCEYEYDEEGQSSRVTGFGGKAVTTARIEAEGKTVVSYADGTETAVWRDVSGNIVRSEAGTGAIAYQYDSGGNLARQTDEGAGETIRYRYDRAGRRVAMASGGRTISYGYGKNGELLSVEDVSQNLFVAYEYDSMGREIARRYGNGTRQDTGYDAVGRVRFIRELSSSGALVRAEGYLYDEYGRRSHSFDGLGTVTVYGYDGQSRLASVKYPFTGDRLKAGREEYDAAGVFAGPVEPRGEVWYLPSADLSRIASVLNDIAPARGNLVRVAQTVWTESYAYDGNGNRLSTTSPWGTVRFGYDAENRLVSKGSTLFGYDGDGNLISEKGLRKNAKYRYTESGRMKLSVVVDEVRKTRAETRYSYDAFGRRTLVQDEGGPIMRTLYDGQSFDALRDSVSLSDGTLLGGYSAGVTREGDASDGRYAWIAGAEGDRSLFIDEAGYSRVPARYSGTLARLYANGSRVGSSRSAAADASSRSVSGGVRYSGFDAQGSVRSSSDEYGSLEALFEYDAFGKPISGDFSSRVDEGYTGKPYDPVTGMYDYGYRDYSPDVARFTTVDPIRDGTNWFAYVNNDPVNYVDAWGLSIYDKLSSAGSLAAAGYDTSDDVKKMSREASFIDQTYTRSNPVNQLDLDNALGINSDGRSTKSCQTTAMINAYAAQNPDGISGAEILSALTTPDGTRKSTLASDGSPSRALDDISKDLAQASGRYSYLSVSNNKTKDLTTNIPNGAILGYTNTKDKRDTHFGYKDGKSTIDSMNPNRRNASNYQENSYRVLSEIKMR